MVALTLVSNRGVERLTGAVRDVDTVGRLGGDEFAVVLPSAGSEPAALDAPPRQREVVQVPVHHRANTPAGERVDLYRSPFGAVETQGKPRPRNLRLSRPAGPERQA